MTTLRPSVDVLRCGGTNPPQRATVRQPAATQRATPAQQSSENPNKCESHAQRNAQHPRNGRKNRATPRATSAAESECR